MPKRWRLYGGAALFIAAELVLFGASEGAQKWSWIEAGSVPIAALALGFAFAWQRRPRSERTHGDMAAAVARLHCELPGWWLSIGWCCISADASLSPDIDGPDTHLVYSDDPRFNEGFHHAYEGDDVAGALHQAIDEALAAKAALTPEQVERAREVYARERANYRRARRPVEGLPA